MSDFILGERRHVARWPAGEIPEGLNVSVPGVRAVEIIDASPGGVCIRGPAALRPGRTLVVRYRDRVGGAERPRQAFVVRCWVHRISRHAVIYESGLMWEGTPGRASRE